ncbi:ATP-binding protein [Streptomyces sp. CBG31]|uniref:ATP-binding protein n=1 Tax=Streptomyces sp. CBG31 TaxID=2762623 RepID=UPI001EFD08B2|nr:ATP-binding protein [Streptomyces sp. CBG31]
MASIPPLASDEGEDSDERCVPRFGPSQQGARTFEVVIAPEPDLVARLRQITRTFLLRRSVPAALADDVVVTVSELVTNGIEHGDGFVVLRARLTDGEALIEVSDENHVPARVKAPTDDEVRGRRLLLVSVLAHDWGVRDEGRTTWAAFRVPGKAS